jgi:hypothetical protein
VTPANNLDDRREAEFGLHFVEFKDDRGKRLRVEKMTAPYPRRLGKFPVTPFLGQ